MYVKVISGHSSYIFGTLCTFTDHKHGNNILQTVKISTLARVQMNLLMCHMISLRMLRLQSQPQCTENIVKFHKVLTRKTLAATEVHISKLNAHYQQKNLITHTKSK